MTLLVLCASSAFSNPTASHASFAWRPFALDDAQPPQYEYWHELILLGERRARRFQAGEEVSGFFPDGHYYPRVDSVGEGVALIAPRAFARAGDRWVEVFVALDETLPDAAADAELRVRLLSLDGGETVDAWSVRPEARFGKLKVDLRRHGLEAARLSVALHAGGERLGVAAVTLEARPAARPLARGERIAVALDVPEGMPADHPVPVTFGVPFPAGALWDPAAVRLVNAAGRELPSQVEVSGRWAVDGAIQWLRFDAEVLPDAGLSVEHAPRGEGGIPARPLEIQETDDGVTVDTGAARYLLGKGASPIREIRQGDRRVAAADGADGLYVIDQQGRKAVACAEGQTMAVEAAGPLAASVRFEGYYRTADGEPLARHITRLEFVAGRPEVALTHTLVLSRHSGEVWFRDIGWAFSVAPGESDPQAAFGASADHWDRTILRKLDAQTSSAYLFQAEHLIFGQGEKRFYAGAALTDGGAEPLMKGEEMGDWAALIGPAGGLVASVRDAARQHPKEFEVTRDRLIIRLFSPRGGEELDFRTETLARKWGLSDAHREAMLQRTAKWTGESNAIGWSKTHRLLLAPLAPGATAIEAATLARPNREPVYAHVDPWWIYATEALGPVHPVDHQQYPEVEAYIDRHLDGYIGENGRMWAFNGFMDFHAGPKFDHRPARGDLVSSRRFYASYGFRPGLWTLYARSGDRKLREFAAGSTRAFGDRQLAHWDGPKKQKGLFVDPPRVGRPWLSPGDMPMYWQGPTELNILGNSNLSQFIHDFYLTGDRRAAELVRQFGEGMKAGWSPEQANSWKRISQTFQCLANVHAFTHDPAYRAMAEATFALFYNPESDIGCWGTTDKPWSTSSDIYIGWETFATPVYYDLAMRLAEYVCYRSIHSMGEGPADRGNFIRAASMLYRHTGDPIIAQAVDFYVRRFATASPGGTIRAGASVVAGLAQDVLARWDAASRARVSWASWHDDPDAAPVGVAVEKQKNETLDLHVRTVAPGKFRGGDWVRALGPQRPWREVGDRTFVSMEVRNSTQTPGISGAGGYVNTRLRFSHEAPEESYAIRPPHSGIHYAVVRVNDRDMERYRQHAFAPLVTPPRFVLFAPQGWRVPSLSATAGSPGPGSFPADIYFRVPEGARHAAIFLSEDDAWHGASRGALLFDPDGEPFNDGEPVSGWIELPSDKPGLWHFHADGTHLGWMQGQRVKVVNLPPFFAFDRPDSYFEPEIPWIEWRSPAPFAAIETETAIDFTVHLAGEGEVTQIEVHLGDEPLYAGEKAPRDLLLHPDALDADETELRVRITTAEFESESVLRIRR